MKDFELREPDEIIETKTCTDVVVIEEVFSEEIPFNKETTEEKDTSFGTFKQKQYKQEKAWVKKMSFKFADLAGTGLKLFLAPGVFLALIIAIGTFICGIIAFIGLITIGIPPALGVIGALSPYFNFTALGYLMIISSILIAVGGSCFIMLLLFQIILLLYRWLKLCVTRKEMTENE
ncbi:MAG: hypothetical protein ATN35_12835 [Epulopiscium sp. Nele67-Bin004]|nr:MAG: hypothetical protein ATN35_12835 [Epulopiscium sp. Nele67-Bin004]